VPTSVDLRFFGGGDGGVAGDVSRFSLRLRISTFFFRSFDELFFVLVVLIVFLHWFFFLLLLLNSLSREIKEIKL
jgi:hypothetical protein